MPGDPDRAAPPSPHTSVEHYLRWPARAGMPAGAMLFDGAQGIAAEPGVLDPGRYGQQVHAVGQGGRQAAWFVSAGFGQGVLRHYRRGGLVARISHDRYIWRGEAATRAFSEFRVMQWLHAQGLRVPAPLAAGYWRHAFTYRAALLTRRIAHARALAVSLDDAPADAVADAIAGMHRLGVWHADLNANNIMLDGTNAVWLIDFDRARRGTLKASERQDNMARLQRSLRKVAGAQGEAFGQAVQKAYARQS